MELGHCYFRFLLIDLLQKTVPIFFVFAGQFAAGFVELGQVPAFFRQQFAKCRHMIVIGNYATYFSIVQRSVDPIIIGGQCSMPGFQILEFVSQISKYRCFFEYFAAKQMMMKEDFYLKISADHNLLNFVDEIDIYTGLKRNDIALVNRIRKQVCSLFVDLKVSSGQSTRRAKNL